MKVWGLKKVWERSCMGHAWNGVMSGVPTVARPPSEHLPSQQTQTLTGHEGAVLAVRFNNTGAYCLSCGKVRNCVPLQLSQALKHLCSNERNHEKALQTLLDDERNTAAHETLVFSSHICNLACYNPCYLHWGIDAKCQSKRRGQTHLLSAEQLDVIH